MSLSYVKIATDILCLSKNRRICRGKNSRNFTSIIFSTRKPGDRRSGTEDSDAD